MSRTGRFTTTPDPRIQPRLFTSVVRRPERSLRCVARGQDQIDHGPHATRHRGAARAHARLHVHQRARGGAAVWCYKPVSNPGLARNESSCRRATPRSPNGASAAALLPGSARPLLAALLGLAFRGPEWRARPSRALGAAGDPPHPTYHREHTGAIFPLVCSDHHNFRIKRRKVRKTAKNGYFAYYCYFNFELDTI